MQAPPDPHHPDGPRTTAAAALAIGGVAGLLLLFGWLPALIVLLIGAALLEVGAPRTAIPASHRIEGDRVIVEVAGASVLGIESAVLLGGAVGIGTFAALGALTPFLGAALGTAQIPAAGIAAALAALALGSDTKRGATLSVDADRLEVRRPYVQPQHFTVSELGPLVAQDEALVVPHADGALRLVLPLDRKDCAAVADQLNRALHAVDPEAFGSVPEVVHEDRTPREVQQLTTGKLDDRATDPLTIASVVILLCAAATGSATLGLGVLLAGAGLMALIERNLERLQTEIPTVRALPDGVELDAPGTAWFGRQTGFLLGACLGLLAYFGVGAGIALGAPVLLFAAGFLQPLAGLLTTLAAGLALSQLAHGHTRVRVDATKRRLHIVHRYGRDQSFYLGELAPIRAEGDVLVLRHVDGEVRLPLRIDPDDCAQLASELNAVLKPLGGADPEVRSLRRAAEAELATVRKATE